MTLDLQPVLDGPTLHLRPLRASDWTPLYAIACDPLLWALHPARDRYLEPVFRTAFDESLAAGGALTAIDRTTGAVIGSSRYSFAYVEPGEVEIGWTYLTRERWGGPVNRELKRLMLRHAFTGVERVMFRIGERNLRSRRAMEKIGGRLTARTHQAKVGGVPVLHVIYTLERDDFLRSPLHLEAA